MFVGCLHRLNYSSVDLSILNSCAKVPGLCPDTDTFFCGFFLSIPCEIENSYVRKHQLYLKFCKSELVKFIIFPVLSSTCIRTRNFPFQRHLTANLYMYIQNVLA